MGRGNPLIIAASVALLAIFVAPAVAQNNLNPFNSLCLELRQVSSTGAQGVCDAHHSECASSPAQFYCTDDDFDPLNGGICIGRACYEVGDTVIVDIELGPTLEVVCGGQVFLRWDVQMLEFEKSTIDPEGELGWTFALINYVDREAGSFDLAVTLPLGTLCGAGSGTQEGGTIARLEFSTIGEHESIDFGFRQGVLPTAISGPAGAIELVGCDGEALPSEPTPMSSKTVCSVAPSLDGDGDGDGDVDLDDFAMFVQCITIPGDALGSDCSMFDFDRDFDVDLSDFGWFQSVSKGGTSTSGGGGPVVIGG